MSFQEDKNQLIEYITQCVGESKNDQELESFFEFIDKLEEKANTEPQYFYLVADAYMQVGNPKKAKAAFSKIYNPKNKKEVKKLLNYDQEKTRRVVRPSQRVTALPKFKYVAKSVLKNKFIASKGCVCSICKKESVPLYIGQAYKSSDEIISFADRQDKFCANCIKDGAAAKALDFKFNSPLLEECTAYAKEQIDELLYSTPECSSAFELCDEDIWPVCCGDFCRYVKQDRDEERYHFQCIHCGRKIVWSMLD